MNTKTTLLIGSCVLATIVSIRFATADASNDWHQTHGSGNAPPQTQPSQNYQGARPGAGNPLPRVAELKGKEGLWITWPGFMMTDNGGSRVFLQTTGSLNYKMKQSKNKILLTFKKANIFLSNNRNPLVTQHFNTPVARINLKKRGKNSELIINMKTEMTPTISQMTDADGYNYLFVDFPAGQYAQGEGTADVRAAYNSATIPKSASEY